MASAKHDAPKKEDYGATGKTKQKQVPGQDGMQPHESHGPNEPDPDTPAPGTPDDDDPHRTERERAPEKA
ncbi:hypothetical protein sos41_04350 [Alphaproteobacteria bacterium SO-S41]|nr:hypothetical protein sos41_04350 [Alphaproteobacteria bacterium SO-S41]